MNTDRNEQKLKRRSRGFLKAPRERYDLLANRVLTMEEFVLLDFIIAMADWDRSHHDTFGTLETTNQAIANRLGWSYDSTVGRYLNSLITKGFITRDDYKRLKPIDFEKWLWRKRAVVSQTLSSDSPELIADLQVPEAEAQENRPQTDDFSLVSSKGALDLPSEAGLTKEDIDWINDNVFPLNGVEADSRLVDEAVEVFTSPL